MHIQYAMLELYSDTSLDLFLDPDSRILHACWKGYQSTNTGIQGCMRLMEMMVAHRAFRILNDNTEVRGLWMGAAEWAAREWFPRMKEAGMERFAWIYSPAKFSQISADTAMALLDPEEIGVKVFHDRDAALEWLIRQD